MLLKTGVKKYQRWADNEKTSRKYFWILKRNGNNVIVFNFPSLKRSSIKLSRLIGMSNNIRGYHLVK